MTFLFYHKKVFFNFTQIILYTQFIHKLPSTQSKNVQFFGFSTFLTFSINYIFLFYVLLLRLKLLFLYLVFRILIYSLQFGISIVLIYFLLILFHVILGFRNLLYSFLANRIIKDDICLSNFFNCFFALSVNTTLYFIIKSQLLFYFI